MLSQTPCQIGRQIRLPLGARPGEQVICPYLRHGINFPPEDILNITMLGGDGASLPWEVTHDGLCITVPEKVPSPIAVSFKIATRGEL